MANIRYAVMAATSISGKKAYKIYKVDFEGRGENDSQVIVKIIEPVAGVYFSMRKNKKISVPVKNLFNNKRQSIHACLAMMRNLATRYNESQLKSSMPLFRNIFESPDELLVVDIDVLYKRLMKELKSG